MCPTRRSLSLSLSLSRSCGGNPYDPTSDSGRKGKTEKIGTSASVTLALALTNCAFLLFDAASFATPDAPRCEKLSDRSRYAYLQNDFGMMKARFGSPI